MSIISPVDRDLAVVYSPLMPVPFRERLLELGMTLVEVPEDEFESMGTNVLAIAPRRCVLLAGNPITRARLETAGVAIESQVTWPRGGRSLYIRDPAGNCVELASPKLWGFEDPDDA